MTLRKRDGLRDICWRSPGPASFGCRALAESSSGGEAREVFESEYSGAACPRDVRIGVGIGESSIFSPDFARRTELYEYRMGLFGDGSNVGENEDGEVAVADPTGPPS